MKKLILVPLLVSSLFLNSCITMYARKDHKSYHETFLCYYVSQYLGDIVFIGNKYHYVFKDNVGQIYELTKPEWQGKLGIEKISLSVNADNQVNGEVHLKTKNQDFKESEQEILRKYGFEKGEKGTFYRELALSGIRYQPRKNSNQNGGGCFSHPYSTKIKYNLNEKEKMKKALITPIAITADGVLLATTGVLYPLIFAGLNK